MVVQRFNRDRYRRSLPDRHCGRCDYPLNHKPAQGTCPECGQDYGYTCKTCRYPLHGTSPRGHCPECGQPFDKGKLINVKWLGKLQLTPRTAYQRLNDHFNRIRNTTVTISGTCILTVIISAALLAQSFLITIMAFMWTCLWLTLELLYET